MKYAYICKDCKKEFEIVAAVGTILIQELNCPNCKSKDIRRLWFPVRVIYKADGFTKKADNE